MPVSVCDSSAAISAALRESISSSSSNNNYKNHLNNNENDTESLQNKLVASAKRVLLQKIDYEEVNNYGQSVLDTLKSKYIVLNSGKYINHLSSSSNNNNGKDTNQNTTTTTSGQPQLVQSQKSSTNELPQPKRILFPRENVQIGWRGSNRKWSIGAGMMNVGNTCYLNSTLQAIFHVPAMANWLISDSAHREKCEDENGTQGGCIICAMSKTLIASQSNQSGGIRPYLVYTKLKLICKHLIMGRQEDAHEFLRYLVEAMEKSYLMRTRNYKDLDQFSKETTPLNQILGGYLKSAVRCLACGHVSTTFQHFQDLLLDIRKANTIEEALDGYFARERLEDMGYKCEACKKKVSATKQFSLERAPISLCIQLKRFSMVGTKLNKHIAIRPRLDLTKYSSKKCNNEPQLTYKLVAMVTHLGASQHCGHYTAIGLTEGGSYYQFDDSCVRPISLQNVLNTNAYIIFYELDDQQIQQNPRQTTSTQVSGDHEKLKDNYNKTNGQNGNNNNENTHNNQQRQGLFSTNNYQHQKIISKLELNGNGGNSTITTNCNNSNRLIGPQLPPGQNNGNSNKNGCNSNNNNFSKLANSSNKFNNNKTNNGETSFSNYQKSSNKSQNNNSNNNNANTNKLLIQFKNINSNNCISASSTSNTGQSNGNNTKFQESNGNFSKFLNKIQTNNKNENNNDNNKSTEMNKTTTTSNKTLPSMPKLLGSPNNEKSLSPKSNDLAPTSTIFNKSSTNNNKNNSFEQKNGFVTSPIKSLVPYESDDDENSDDEKQQQQKSNKKNSEIHLNGSSGSNNHNNKKEINLDNKINNNKRKLINNFDKDVGTSSNDSSPDIKRSKSTPPSPPVIKTKTGLWQVTSLEPAVKSIESSTKTTPSSSSGLNNSSSNCGERKNPFSSTGSITTNNFYSGKFNSKKNIEDRGPVVKELLKYSHRGYGGTVFNWNGQKTDMEKAVTSDIKMDRKREMEDDEENEMDRGKQKKTKIHGPQQHGGGMRNDNPGYNPFQEHQLQNNQNRRWNGGNNNNHNNGGGGGRFQHQNNNGFNRHNNNNNHYNRNHNNNFRRNKYQQHRMHQRNGGWR